ncbi:zinc finger, PHD-type [Artemisia annua]|uniref:Zinc finger, PHD-type n=1 Tax=Artemisia annua TaxID=35608 RepID=A0A2U1NRH4_ARTAN|nr:zinc finger, PHD-type [Artemisia annua]
MSSTCTVSPSVNLVCFAKVWIVDTLLALSPSIVMTACYHCKKKLPSWRCGICDLASHDKCAAVSEYVVHSNVRPGKINCWRHSSDSPPLKHAAPASSIEHAATASSIEVRFRTMSKILLVVRQITLM